MPLLLQSDILLLQSDILDIANTLVFSDPFNTFGA
jgi:hypothetical protein